MDVRKGQRNSHSFRSECYFLEGLSTWCMDLQKPRAIPTVLVWMLGSRRELPKKIKLNSSAGPGTRVVRAVNECLSLRRRAWGKPAKLCVDVRKLSREFDAVCTWMCGVSETYKTSVWMFGSPREFPRKSFY